MRRIAGGWAVWCCGLFVGVVVLLSSSWLDPSTLLAATTGDRGITASGQDAKTIQHFPLSTVRAHAPGFSVIDNLYWHNGTYIIVTDQPWHVPNLDEVARLSTDGEKPSHGRIAIEIIAIRYPSVTPASTEEDRTLGESTSLQEVIDRYGRAEVIEGPAMINNDDNFINHYYHWIGETFLGSWRVWSNHAWRSGLHLPPIKRIAFPKVYGEAEKPMDSDDAVWEDRPGANAWFMHKFFPSAEIETRTTWEARASSGKVYRISTAILADRAAGQSGPSSGWKPWGDALRLPVSPDWLTNLRDRILEGYQGPVSLKKPELPVITYLARQNAGRRLHPPDHEALWTALQGIEAAGLAEVNMEDFNSTIPFETQVATIARTNILVAVHGNGLTHSLWMSPGGSNAVFEFQPAICTITDYGPLAVAAGVRHYLVHENSFCTPETCGIRGCEIDGAINSDAIRLTPSVVTNEIRKLLAM